MQIEQLLPLLADGEFHSGEELGARLQVSRAAMWKQLQRLQAETGLAVEAVKGRGYRLPGGIELLDRARTFAALTPSAAACVSDMQVMLAAQSTNTLALDLAQQGAPTGTVVVAEHQLNGRGRRGRSWISPFGRNLYCSVVWRYHGGAAAIEGLSLAVGVALAEGLARSGVPGLSLKWPNDLMCNGAKLGGILIEITGDMAGPCAVVVGFGINVMLPEEQAGAIGQPWTDVTSACDRPPGRNELLGAMLSQLLPLLRDYETVGFSAYQMAWDRLDALKGRPVRVVSGVDERWGTAAGVNTGGALLLRSEDREEVIVSGEVSVRLLE